MELVSLDDVQVAAADIAGVVLRTPLLRTWWDADLWLKPESLQPVGSFKLRGATHAVARLTAAERARGVVTHSSGNHGLALAYAARTADVPCRIVVPEGAPAVKVDRIRALGVEVITVPPPRRGPEAERIAAETGAVLVPPFDDRRIIAGQGTIGLEIVEDLPDVDVVLVPIGGGGLSSGIATAVTALRPAATVIGVEPDLAADTRDSLAAGSVVVWGEERTYRTMADGLRLPPSTLTLAHLRARLDGIVTVTEEEIRAAMGRLVRDARLVVEPSAAVAVAARLFHASELPGGRTVAVVTGGNVDPAVLASVLGC
ncbi:pyridoxal-phosphate dependent enzyme [Micromonospora sp. WMMC415]|uniref:threonine ammonia-lyase n=1 Tax=Micromonospora sp. WMMC415 TaxID=2675222 RepID=UPI0012B453DD|nr:threonine/serine dehydratase [Micromonospora sp. WMMC415]QGN45896.1 pyridoxal-phosphate dependent enzyme [Micromonospora sp. WMMC415]